MAKITLDFMQRFMSNLNTSLKNYIIPPSLGIGYGTCSTSYATAEKAVTLENYRLVKGGCINVKFTNYVNKNATLNVNSKGAKPIYYRGEAIRSEIIKAGDIATFVYNGTQFDLLGVDRASTNEENVLTHFDLTFSDVLDSAYINGITVNAQLINQNLMMFSAELSTTDSTPSITFPAYDTSTTKVFCRTNKFKVKNSWYDNGNLECNGQFYNIAVGTSTVNSEQCLVIYLRRLLTISGKANIKFNFMAWVERI